MKLEGRRSRRQAVLVKGTVEAVWSPWFAVAVALVFGAVELHRAAGWRWWLGGAWCIGILAADAIVAGGLAVTVPALLPPAVHGMGVEFAVGLVSAATGTRLFYLVPVPGASAAGERFTSLRRYAIEQVERAARIQRSRYVLDVVYPAALRLPYGELERLVAVMLDDYQRSGKLTSPVDLETRLARSGADRLPALMRVVLEYGGADLCREILRRAARVHTDPAGAAAGTEAGSGR